MIHSVLKRMPGGGLSYDNTANLNVEFFGLRDEGYLDMQHVAVSGAIIIARKITYIITLNTLFPTFFRSIVTDISHVLRIIAGASGVLLLFFIRIHETVAQPWWVELPDALTFLGFVGCISGSPEVPCADKRNPHRL
jgi:hypothetical protein